MGSVSNQQFAVAEEPQLLHRAPSGAGICRWFNVRMGFSGAALDTHPPPPRRWRERVEFTFKKSAKGLDSIRVTGLVGYFVLGGDRCYNCGGLDHHAEECKLPPQPKKCHFCESISRMVASCPLKAQQAPSSQGEGSQPIFREEEEEIHSPALLPEAQN
ncbi:unnamed protein product [Nyctereutes procyonoides]|uniref:(raccoon dog) hypothetical protein n=1 Tax=Nyctereutes procyonoides TaxID=34880 RepID=A0A811Y7D2_NYCPR|nr:unnamed protein product [Nyctereutes procyonoides]